MRRDTIESVGGWRWRLSRTLNERRFWTGSPPVQGGHPEMLRLINDTWSTGPQLPEGIPCGSRASRRAHLNWLGGPIWEVCRVPIRSRLACKPKANCEPRAASCCFSPAAWSWPMGFGEVSMHVGRHIGHTRHPLARSRHLGAGTRLRFLPCPSVGSWLYFAGLAGCRRTPPCPPQPGTGRAHRIHEARDAVIFARHIFFSHCCCSPLMAEQLPTSFAYNRWQLLTGFRSRSRSPLGFTCIPRLGEDNLGDVKDQSVRNVGEFGGRWNHLLLHVGGRQTDVRQQLMAAGC